MTLDVAATPSGAAADVGVGLRGVPANRQRSPPPTANISAKIQLLTG